MPDKPTIADLAALIGRHATFDASADTRCPKCGLILDHGSRWFDHASELAAVITQHCGLGRRVTAEIEDIVGSSAVSTNVGTAEACRRLAARIWEHLYA